MRTTMAQQTTLTTKELRDLVREIIQQELAYRDRGVPRPKKSWQQTLAALDELRWTPPDGTPSVAEMIREERER